jgi:SulP family sulfate permease
LNPAWRYVRLDFASDLAAGCAVAAVSIPIVLAYADLTGLPSQAGLYSAMLGATGYAIFGPSRIIVGPDTATCILIGATLTQLGSTATGDRNLDAAIIALLVGIFCFAGSLLRLGMIANLLSKPILAGYLVGVASTLFVGQYHSLTGVAIASDGIIRPTVELLGKLGQIHWPTLAAGLSLFILARLLKYFTPRLPSAVAVLVVGIAASWLLDLPRAGIAVVGDIHLALPHLPDGLPSLNLSALFLDALGIAVVSFSSGIVTTRSFAAQLGEAVDPNLELRGFAAANIAAALGMGYPVSGADSRTAVALSTGGRTRFVAVFAAFALAILTIFLSTPLSILPIAALGAILANAAIDLMDLKTLWRLRRISRVELTLGILTAAGVVGLGVMNAIIIAIVASLLHVLWYAATPGDTLQGVIPGRPGLYDLNEDPAAEPIPGVLIYLFEGTPLFFNAARFKSRVMSAVERYPHQPIRWFLLNARMMVTLDSTAYDELLSVVSELKERGITFVLAGGSDRFREIVARSGLRARIGAENVYESVSTAVVALQLLADNRPPQTIAESTTQMDVRRLARQAKA